MATYRCMHICKAHGTKNEQKMEGKAKFGFKQFPKY